MSRAGRNAWTHNVYRHGQRHMELMPSLSRSSGLDKDGDSLKNFKTQEEYREFIQTKLDRYWQDYYPRSSSKGDIKRRDEVEGNLLILFRKLREGFLATGRSDTLALEVYEISLHLCLLFNSPTQATSVISHLLPKVYLSSSKIPETASVSALLSSLHFLATAYPSQSRYNEHRDTLGPKFIPAQSAEDQWLSKLTRTLRQRNYAALDALTSRDTLSKLVLDTAHSSWKDALAFDALCTLVDALRSKARDTTWLVLRSAYRELHIPRDVPQVESCTPRWLCRSLTLRSVMMSGTASDTRGEDDTASLISEWLNQKNAAGEVRSKEGSVDRWIVCKIPVA